MLPLMNSSEPVKRLRNFAAAGSTARSSFFSASVRMKLPPSDGLLPHRISGTSASGLVRLVTKLSEPGVKYGLMLAASLTSGCSASVS